MPVIVDIEDRLYDYTDEERALEAVEAFQAASGLDDHAIVALWADEIDPRRLELETQIIDAIDANGSARRARENVPASIKLAIA